LELIEAFVSSGGSGPRYAEVAMCYAKSEEDARNTPHHYFRWSVAGWPVMAELPDTEGFAAASKQVGGCALNARPRKTLGWKTPAEALDAWLR
jgi:hypothetical protein